MVLLQHFFTIAGIFEHKLADDFTRVEMQVNGTYHAEFHAHISSHSQETFKKTALKRKGEEIKLSSMNTEFF